MWDKTTFNAAAIDKELEIAEKTGMNSLRAVLQYAVYEDDPQYFLKTLDTFMALCARHYIKFIPAFFDDCSFGIKSDPAVTEVSFDSGFNDVSYFFKTFKAKLSVSPLSYRKNYVNRLSV